MCILARDLNGGPIVPWYRSELDRSYDLEAPPGGLSEDRYLCESTVIMHIQVGVKSSQFSPALAR